MRNEAGFLSKRDLGRGWLKSILAALLLSLVALPGSACAQESLGGSRFHVKGASGRKIQVWAYAAPNRTPEAPILIVMHGAGRDADRYLEEWRPLADQYGLIIAAPEFSLQRYPTAREYNQGNLQDLTETLRDPSEWTFAEIDKVFAALQRRYRSSDAAYDLFGHSAGGQFVHRFALLQVQSRADRLVAANAGWYTMPDLATGFPFGLAGTPIDAAGLRGALQRPLTLLLGTADVARVSPSLRVAPETQAQGPHRLARGERFYAAARAAAEALDAEFRWRLAYAPGVGHENGAIAPFAARLLYGSEPAHAAADGRLWLQPGEAGEAAAELEARMRQASEALDFEEAARLRDELLTLAREPALQPAP